MSVLKNLEPQKVFQFFEEISHIPRCSYHTKAVSDYCAKFARDRGLTVIQDSLNDIIIKKPGTKGYEKSEPLILQGHLDMVCEKTEDSGHDFSKDPLDLCIEDGFVKAKDTTLGADNGIAVAMILALLDSRNLPHPPIEALFTVDEEVGMDGALGVDLSLLSGKMLINLDSEDDDTLIAGCAGGFNFRLSLPFSKKEARGDRLDMEIRGLKGGHSGAEIDRQRGNANKLAGRLLTHLGGNASFHLSCINGGTKGNVITPLCKFTLVSEHSEEIVRLAKEMSDTWKKEFGKDEPSLDLLIKKTPDVVLPVMDDDSAKKVIFFLTNCRNGVYEFSRVLKGFVETSDNLGIVKTEENEVIIEILARSSSSSKLKEMKESFVSFAQMLEGKYQVSGEYQGWMFKEKSKVRSLVADAFQEVLGKPVEVATIHAGLECGILSGRDPSLDCISFGPKIFEAHTVRERLDIASVQRIWEILKVILKDCK